MFTMKLKSVFLIFFRNFYSYLYFRGVESFHSGFYLDPCEVGQGDVGECGGEMIRVAGRVMNPLKISLSRNQYKQLLETMQSPLEVRDQFISLLQFISRVTHKKWDFRDDCTELFTLISEIHRFLQLFKVLHFLTYQSEDYFWSLSLKHTFYLVVSEEF